MQWKRFTVEYNMECIYRLNEFLVETHQGWKEYIGEGDYYMYGEVS